MEKHPFSIFYLGRLRKLVFRFFQSVFRSGVLCDDPFVHDDCLDIRHGRRIIHDRKHDLLHDGAQAARARSSLNRKVRDLSDGSIGELDVDPIKAKQFFILLDDRVLRLFQDPCKRLAVEILQGNDDRQTAYQLRDQTVFQYHVP